MADGTWDGPGIAGYSDFRQLGRGGFSVVYRATQKSLDRQVAIKILLTDMTDERDVRRFQRECAVLGKLGRNRNVIEVYDAGVTADRRPYIVMKLYPRGTLANRLRDQPLVPVAEAVGIIVDLSQALQYAHDHGVIHRDIKPENVLIDDDGTPVLSDFGVAAVMETGGNDTTSVAFSEAYVAPEVLDRGEFGTASDIYSLATVAYWMLTGRAPFDELSGAKRIIAITTQAPPPIVRSDVPASVAQVVLDAMAKDPAKRPVSAEEFGAQLRLALAVSSISPRPAAPAAGEADLNQTLYRTTGDRAGSGRQNVPSTPSQRSASHSQSMPPPPPPTPSSPSGYDQSSFGYQQPQPGSPRPDVQQHYPQQYDPHQHSQPQYPAQPLYPQSQYPPRYAQPDYNQQAYSSGYSEKSRVTAGILGLLLGGLGAHRFYLGYPGIAVLQILVTILTLGVGALWGVIEGILILAGSDSFRTDANGLPLRG